MAKPVTGSMTGLSLLSKRFRSTPARPFSPVSIRPLSSVSYQTRLPRLTGSKKPKSTVRLLLSSVALPDPSGPRSISVVGSVPGSNVTMSLRIAFPTDTVPLSSRSWGSVSGSSSESASPPSIRLLINSSSALPVLKLPASTSTI